MKTITIKITGSGTKNQIETRLLDLVRELQTSEIDEIEKVYEDSILCTTISVD